MRAFVFILSFLFSFSAFSTSIYFNPVDGFGIPISEGSWDNPMNWSLTEGGAPCNSLPVSGDNIIIPTGKKVNITSTIDLTTSPCAATLVDVFGEMFFIIGRKLKIGCNTGTCNSYIKIHDGGLITPEKSSGNANYIEICSDIVWSASDGDVTGPSNLPISALPVELVSINAKCMNQTTLVEWSTSSEVNNKQFIVEHSTDGIEFKAIGVIEGNGNSNHTIEYEYIHNNPTKGVNYYRLQQQDYNGDVHYSPITSAAYNNYTEEVFKIYPNPICNGQTLKLIKPFDNNFTISIYNTQSQLIYEKEIQETSSTIKLNDLNHQLKKGIYLVVIISDFIKVSEKLIVQ